MLTQLEVSKRRPLHQRAVLPVLVSAPIHSDCGLLAVRVCASVHPDWLYPLQTAPVSSLHVLNGSGSSPGLLAAEITESASRRQVQSEGKRGIPRHGMLRALAARVHPEAMMSVAVKGESDGCVVGGKTSPLSLARSHFSQGQRGRKHHNTRVLLSPCGTCRRAAQASAWGEGPSDVGCCGYTPAPCTCTGCAVWQRYITLAK